MEHSDWATRDYETARTYIEDHEEIASRHPVLDCGNGVTAILPLNVPGLGFRLHGLIMLAPIPLLMLSALLFPVFGFMGSWEVSFTSLSLTAGSLILLLGLFRVILLVVGQRETFPRQYFATLGPQGIAMHFSRFQLPLCNPRQQIPWKQVKDILPTRVFFVPGILILKPVLSVLKIESTEGKTVYLPAPSPPDSLTRLKALIKKQR